MITALLNHLPTWVLAALTVGGTATLSVLGCLAARRRFPDIARGEHNELIGVLLGVFAAIYGVLLAFVIFILWEDRVDAETTVAAEATSLSQVVLDAQALPPPVRASVLSSVNDYVHAVSTDEWDRMREGRREPAPTASAALDRLRNALRGHVPGDDAEAAFYSGAVAGLEDVAAHRRARLAAGANGPVALFEVLLVAGAVVFAPLTFLFGHRSRLAHALFVGISTALVALGLLLTVVLGQPYAGDQAVDPRAYREGVLAQFWEDQDARMEDPL